MTSDAHKLARQMAAIHDALDPLSRRRALSLSRGETERLDVLVKRLEKALRIYSDMPAASENVIKERRELLTRARKTLATAQEFWTPKKRRRSA